MKKYFIFSRSLRTGSISCSDSSYPLEQARDMANALGEQHKELLYYWIEEAPEVPIADIELE